MTHCTEFKAMALLLNTFKLSAGQRKVVAALAVVLTMNSTRVQAAESSSVLPDAPRWETGRTTQDDGTDIGLRVPVTPAGQLKPAEDVAPTRVMRVTMTAYTSAPWECDDSPFVTADGSRVRDGVVAVNFLKFGTRIRIPELYGEKIFEVHDRMHKRFLNRLDIWMPNVSEGRKFGIKRNVAIEIL